MSLESHFQKSLATVVSVIPLDSLSSFPSSLKGSSQRVVVSATLKPPPISPGSDAIPYPLTVVSLSHDGDAGVLVLGASLHYSSAFGSIPDTHLTAQWVP